MEKPLTIALRKVRMQGKRQQIPEAVQTLMEESRTERDVLAQWYDGSCARLFRYLKSPFELMYQYFGSQMTVGYLIQRQFSQFPSQPVLSRNIPHRHDYIEMTYVLEGGLEQVVGNTVVALRTGDFFIVGKNCVHYEQNWESGTIILWLCFKDSFFQYQMQKMTENKSPLNRFFTEAVLEQKSTGEYITFHPYDSCSGAEELLLKIVLEIQEREICYMDMVKILVTRLFQVISREYDFTVTQDEYKTDDDHFFFALNQYLRGNLESVTVGALEERFHFGRNYYNKLIRRKTGMTYSAYLTKLRLEESERLLTRTDLSVTAIINRVGLSNRHYFYKLFGDAYQMTPKDYRKLHKLI